MTAPRRQAGTCTGDARQGERRNGRFRHLAVLLLVALAASAALEGPHRSDVPGLQATQRAMLQALVLPQLSLECLVAIGSALVTCTSPGLGGAVTCGVALLHVLNTCPW